VLGWAKGSHFAQLKTCGCRKVFGIGKAWDGILLERRIEIHRKKREKRG
jgi:hypothetical protein